MSNKANSKIVKELVRNHIIESIQCNEGETISEKLESFKEQLEINSKSNKREMSFRDSVACTLNGIYGDFHFETYEIEKFINTLDINNNSGKKYTSEQTETLYINLIARESKYLFKKLEKDIER